MGKAPRKEDWIVEHHYEYLLKQAEWQREKSEMEYEELEKMLNVEQASKQEKEMQLLAAQSEKNKLEAEYKDRMQQMSASRDEKEMQICCMQKEQKRLKLELQSVYASHSWKVTRIFRKSKSLLEKHLSKIRKG